MVGQNNTPLYIITVVIILILAIILIVIFLSGTNRCTKDSDCGTGSCYRGSCIDLPPVNVDTRKCISNSQCNFGEYCLNNVCLIKPCQVLSDCASGTFCDNNVCTTGKIVCTNDADTTPGCQALDACSTSAQCGNGMLCFQGECQLPGLNGQACLSNLDCILGTCSNFQCLVVAGTCTDNSNCSSLQRCSLGICVAKKQLGDSCNQNSDCNSGFCSNQNVCVSFAETLGQPCNVDPCQLGLDCDSNGICQTGPLPQLGQPCIGLNSCTFNNYCGLSSVCVARTSPIYSSPSIKYDYYFGVADELVPVSFDNDDLDVYSDANITVSVNPNSGDDIITDYIIKFSFTNQLPQLRKITKHTGRRLDDLRMFQLYILDTETVIDPSTIFTSNRTTKDLYYYTEYYFGTKPLYRYTIPNDVAVTVNFHSPGHQFLTNDPTYTLPGNIILEGQLIGFSIN